MAAKQNQKITSHLAIARRQYSQGNLAQAEKLCRQYLRTKKNSDVEAICLLGQILGDAGKHQEGAKEIQNALKLAPDAPEPKIIMGKLSIQAGRLELAKTWFIRALHDNSELWEAYKYLGELAMDGYDTLHAISYLEKAHKLKPDDIEIESQLANAYSSHGKLTESIKHYKNVIKLSPDNVAARCNLAGVLRVMGEFDEAQEHYTSVLKNQPGYPAAIAGMVELYEIKDGHEIARQTIHDAVIIQKIKHPELALVFARIMQRSGQRDDLEQARNYLETIIKDKTLALGLRSILNMSLGFIYEKQNNYQKSFQCYQAGNSLHSQHFSKKEHTKLIDDIIQSFSQSQFVSLPKSQSISKLPIFIVGMPRSGTSLAEQILSSHSKVHGAGELTYLHESAINLHKRLNVEIEYPQCINLITQQQVNDMANEHTAYLKQFTLVDENESANTEIIRITDKMPQNFMHLGLIACIFPKAKIIHCQRHPLDTCFSIYATRLSPTHGYAYKLKDIAIAYRQYRRLMDHWQSLLVSENSNVEIFNLSYEKLVSDQKIVTAQLLDFCGLDWDENCLNFHKSKRVVITASMDQVRKPINRGSVLRYKKFDNYLTNIKNELSDFIDSETEQ